MRFLPLALLAALCALLAFGMMRDRTAPPTSPMVGKKLPEVMLGGKSLQQSVDGRVAIINLFASWCAPCALEHPALMRIKEKNIAPIIGIAWKNKPEDVMKWLNRRGIPYKAILMDEQGAATLPLALTGVPETFVVGKGGVIAYHTSQPLSDAVVVQEIIPLVERLQQQ